MNLFGVIIIALLYPFSLSSEKNSVQFERCSDSDVLYTVQKGDNLYRIADRFGDHRFWESIYIANADQVNNPHLIFPGQEIRIPQNVAKYSDSGVSLSEVLENPFCNISEVPIASVNEVHLQRYRMQALFELLESEELAQIENESINKEDVSEEELAEFREAFNTLVSNEEKAAEQRANSEKKIFRELDGMVHDETRSKFGRDFYDIFYTHWQSPPEASNYSIRITEQPAPSLGSIITVKVNDDETFKVRLQPKYDFIEEASKYAVRTTYVYLRDNKTELKIY